MDIKELKNCFSKFATGVMIAALKCSENDELHGLTINSFSSVSLEPPLVSFCIGNESRNLERFQNNEFFTLNILSDSQLDLALAFAKVNNPDKWGVEKYLLTKNSCPVFENSLGYFECKRFKVVEAGDHHIIIGQIIDFKNLNEEKSPLIYFKSQFC